MNSAGILMNITTATAAAATPADAPTDSGEGFTAALTALQGEPAVQSGQGAKPCIETALEQTADSEDVSALAIIASLLMQTPAAAANDATGGNVATVSETAGESTSGASAVDLSPLLAPVTAANTGPAQSMPADASAGAASSPPSAESTMIAAPRVGLGRAGIKRDAQDAPDATSQPDSDAETHQAGERLLLGKLQDAFGSATPVAASSTPALGAAVSAAATASAATNSGPQSVAAAVHLATTLTRDGAADVAPPLHGAIREPVGSPRWADEIGSRLVLMSVRGQQEGSLTLTPEHLGPLEVQISVNKDTANVWFGAQHAETRAALTDAMPRLRELLAASGLSLGQSGVSEQAPRRAAPEAANRAGGAVTELSAAAEATVPAWRPMRSGLVDTYA